MPDGIVAMCEAVNVSWSIVENCTEGSSSATDAAMNKFRKRLVILLPQDIDGLPDLSLDEPPPMYTDERTEWKRKATSKRNIFDTLSCTIA